MRRIAYLLLMMLFLLPSCKREHKVIRGIYYWKTVYNPTDYEQDVLKRVHCRNVYLRLFDIDWNEEQDRAVPLGIITMKQRIRNRDHYTPVIFITQKTLSKINNRNTQGLARAISNLAMDVCRKAKIRYKEVQVDCDWTATTKEQYFELLNALKQEEFFKGKEISCTIRMHQLKYMVSSGIPPVDKGLLMCYNLGNIKNVNTVNSILDYKEAEKYLTYADKYPLALDVALPLFSWCLLFRNDALKGILRDVPPSLVRQSQLFERKDNTHYTCKADTFWHGYTFQKGDVLRLEESLTREIIKTAELTSRQIKNDKLHITLFHCDSLTLSKYATHELEAMYRAYR